MKTLLKWLAFPFKAVWNYIKVSWEGSDGQFSYKRASQFVFVMLCIKIVWMGFTNAYQVWALLILTVTFLLLAAIISVEQIIGCLNAISNLKSQLSDLLNKATTTTTDQTNLE